MELYFNQPECSISLDQYFSEIADIPVLSEDQEKLLGFEAAKGNLEARNTLIKSHLKYVVSIAKKLNGKGVPLADLISEGNIGLLFAAEEFDPNKGRFSSYASYWINKSMYDAIKDCSGITHTDVSSSRFENYRAKLKQRISNRYRTNNIEFEPFAWINEALSLDQSFSDEDTSTMLDFLADENQNPEDKIIAADVTNKLSSILSNLPEKEKMYVSLYFGLDGNKAMSIEEIASAYKEPVGKVNRTIKNTLRTLRTNEKIKALRNYISE